LRNPIELAEQYVAVWNEPSPEVRLAIVRELWVEEVCILIMRLQVGESDLDDQIHRMISVQG
jgi:hypothetical protein